MDDAQRKPLVDRQFLLACAVMVSTSMVFYLLLTTMALYAVERFAATDALAGLSATAFVLGSVITRLASPIVTRVFGRRAVLITSAVASILFAMLMPFADELWQLIAIRLLHGAAFGATGTLVVAGVLTRVPARRRAEAAGYLGVSSTLSTAAGPFLAILLLDAGGFPALFTAAIVITVLGAVSILPMKLPDGRRTADDLSIERSDSRLRKQVLREGYALGGLCAVIFMVGLAYAGIAVFLTMHAVERDAPWSVGPYFALYAAVAFVGRLTLGRVQDRYGDNVVVLPVLAAFSLSLAMLGAAPDGVLIALAGVPMGLGFGMFLPAMQAAAARIVSPARLTVAVAAVYVALDLGVGVAPFALGPLIALIGTAPMYLVLAALVVGAAALYLFVHGRLGRRPGFE